MPDGAPGDWLDRDDFSSYIQRLASCGLQKLSSECDALKDEQAGLLEQTKELAYKEYLTFIHASDCSKSLQSQLGSLEQQLSRTSSSVAALHTTLDSFVNTSRSLLVSRQLNSTTLAKHTQLLEVLSSWSSLVPLVTGTTGTTGHWYHWSLVPLVTCVGLWRTLCLYRTVCVLCL
ncbi:Conserved oligomeric Golgi complex subunit 8 [Trinorchestia longiramus]|nr:Conserved oligomeric Golgi complex subunit 8 [Trinorchestia longiramus]